MSTKILSREEITYLKEINKQVRYLEKNNKYIRPIFILSENAWSKPLAKLYENRVEGGDDLMYMLDNQKVEIKLSQTGDLNYSTKVSGGGTRTGSLGGVIIGGLIAGPVGAAVGALAPHSKEIKTEQVKIDTRCLVLEISGPRGSIVVSEPFIDQSGKEKRSFQLKAFFEKYKEAKGSYKKHKKAIDEKFADVMEYKKEYYKVKDEYSSPKNATANKKGSDKLRNNTIKPSTPIKTSNLETNRKDNSVKNARNLRNNSVQKPKSCGEIATGLVPSILSLVLFLLPLVGFILGIVGLVQSIIYIRRINSDGKAIAALIMSIIGILWGFFFSLAFIIAMFSA